MKPAPRPANENDRQKSLEAMQILETAIEERFERVTRMAARILGTPIAALSLIDGDRQWFKSVLGLAASEGSRETSFCGHVVAHGEMVLVEDATKDERFVGNPDVDGGIGIRFYAGCPVRSPDGFTVGSLCVIDREPRTLTASQLEDLRDLAAMVEVEFKSRQLAVAQVQMQQELEQARKAVLVDPLTRLWNRQGGEEFLARQHRFAVQKGEKFCLAMLDIDHFKKINDTFGHPVGDEVLREVARRILRGIREQDFVCRMGGEEFLLMIADPLATEALQVAQEVRKIVRSSPVQALGHSVPVTISIGLAYFDPAAAVSCDEVIRLADQGLYQAKQAGRDRIVSHLENSA
jgi:diguanylate cyclase (GGDEF)-like protein